MNIIDESELENPDGLKIVNSEDVKEQSVPVKIRCCRELELMFMSASMNKDYYHNREVTYPFLKDKFKELIKEDINILNLHTASKPSLPVILSGSRTISPVITLGEIRLLGKLATILYSTGSNIKRLYVYMCMPYELFGKFPSLAYQYMNLEDYIKSSYDVDLMQSERIKAAIKQE